MRRRPGECVVIDAGPMVEYILFDRVAERGAGAPEFHCIHTALHHRAMRDALEGHPGRLSTTSGVIVEVHRLLRGFRDPDRGHGAWRAMYEEFTDRSIMERSPSLRELGAFDPALLRDLGPVDASVAWVATLCLSEYESAYVLTSDGPLIRACAERRIPTRRVSELPQP